MKKFKQTVIRLFFCIEILVVGILFVGGSNGLPHIVQLKRENKALVKEIELLAHETNELEIELAQWNEQSFNKEKTARELLQMAKKDEIVYFVN